MGDGAVGVVRLLGLSAVTAIEVALSWLILVLLGLAVREMLHCHRHSDLSLPRSASPADGVGSSLTRA